MKFFLFIFILFTQSTKAVIVNYSCFVSPDEKKRKIHLFADKHIDNYTSATQQIEALRPFLLNNRDAIFYVDSYHENYYLDNLMGFKQLLEQYPILKEKYTKFSHEKLKELLTDAWLMGQDNGLLQRLFDQTAYLCAFLYKTATFLLGNGVAIKGDERLNPLARGPNYIRGSEITTNSTFDDSLLEDCLCAEKDVIIFAGSAHIKKLELLLSDSYKFNCALRLSREYKIKNIDREDSFRPLHTYCLPGLSLTTALNNFIQHTIQEKYDLFVQDFAIKPELLRALVEAAEDLAELGIFTKQPLPL